VVPKVPGARKEDIPQYRGAVLSYGKDSAEDVAADIEAHFGPGITARHIAAAAGAPDDAIQVRVSLGSGGPGGLHVFVETPTGNMSRTVVSEAEGARPTTIKNESYFIYEGHQGKGEGTRIFAAQVKAAAALGFREIRTHAIRDVDANGYYSWPRMGYDGRVPSEITAIAPRQFSGYEKVSDFMKTPEGRDWWKENGDEVYLEFDLTPGSLSRRTLDAYAKSKGVNP